MTRITVYDPALRRFASACGPRIDQHMVDFAADPDWLKTRRTQVRRINRGQEPAKLVAGPEIRALPETDGEAGLPETTPALETARLRGDPGRAGITPCGRVVTTSLAATGRAPPLA